MIKVYLSPQLQQFTWQSSLTMTFDMQISLKAVDKFPFLKYENRNFVRMKITERKLFM